MPKPISYGEELESVICMARIPCRLHWIRLKSKKYTTVDFITLEEKYIGLEDISPPRLDGIIITGAPVEKMSFEDITYWDELSYLIKDAINSATPLFGICWGAIAVGHAFGLNRVIMESKQFGCFLTNKAHNISPVASALPETLYLPLSTWAKFHPGDVYRGRSSGVIQLLSGPAGMIEAPIISTTDGYNYMCLGHPEYPAHRLVREWERDSLSDRNAPPPHNISLINPETFWRNESIQIFQSWLHRLL